MTDCSGSAGETFRHWEGHCDPRLGAKTPRHTEVTAGRSFGRMGLGRVELPTSRLSGVRSNHLSYRPLTGTGA